MDRHQRRLEHGAQNWSPQAVPTGIDTAIIANPGSVTIAAGANNAVANLTLGGTNDTLEVDGALVRRRHDSDRRRHARSRRHRDAERGRDHRQRAAGLRRRPDAGHTPLSLGGTLAVQNAGTLTLGPGETITQTAPSATIDSTAAGSESIVNQGTIDANTAATRWRSCR